MIAGDVDGCAALGTALQRAATGVAAEAQQLGEARATALSGWSGAGADAFAAEVVQQQRAGAALSQALGQAGRALTAFAADLAGAQDLARRASLCDDAVEAEHLLALARRAEDDAHDRLGGGLRGVHAEAARRQDGWDLGLPGPLDWADLTSSLVLAPRAFAERAAQEAEEAGRLARLLKEGTKVGSAAERAVARREWRDALRDYHALRAVEAEYDDLGRLVPAPRWLVMLDEPLSATVPVLNKIPIASVLLVGVGTGLDVHDGMSPGLAVTKNVAATGAGMLAYSGAAAGLVAVGVVGAPVILGAVAAGFVVSWGVGEVITHYGDDITAAAGAVADAVGDAADAVGDAAGDAADAVGDAAGDAADAVGDAAGAVGDAAGDAADAVGDTASKAWHSVFG